MQVLSKPHESYTPFIARAIWLIGLDTDHSRRAISLDRNLCIIIEGSQRENIEQQRIEPFRLLELSIGCVD